jgi:hypothetical protein
VAQKGFHSRAISAIHFQFMAHFGLAGRGLVGVKSHNIRMKCLDLLFVERICVAELFIVSADLRQFGLERFDDSLCEIDGGGCFVRALQSPLKRFRVADEAVALSGSVQNVLTKIED